MLDSWRRAPTIFTRGRTRRQLEVMQFHLFKQIYDILQLTMTLAREIYASAFQLSILRNCPEIMSRQLRKGQSVLLTAKVLVISRLLHNKQSKNPRTTAFVETIRDRLGNLRRKLLVAIDRRFQSESISKEDLVDAMCAFSLATSSSQTDVLRHFLHLRSQAMSGYLETDSGIGDNLISAFNIMVRTIADTRGIFLSRLTVTLADLKSKPLLKGDDILTIDEFNSDSHQQWIGEDIRTFTPYIRNDGLQSSVVAEQLLLWTKATLSILTSTISTGLSPVADMPVLFRLRTSILASWLSCHYQVAGLSHTEVLDSLREAFTSRFIFILRKRCNYLSEVTFKVEAILADWKHEYAFQPSMWDLANISTDLTNGSESFKKAILDRTWGQTHVVKGVMRDYEVWLEGIESILTTIKDIEEAQWEILEDYDDEEDECEILDGRAARLTRDDAATLRDQLSKSINTAYTNMYDTLRALIEAPQNTLESPKAVLLIRILRGISKNRPTGQSLEQKTTSPTVSKLYQIVCSFLSQQTVAQIEPGILYHATRKSSLPERALWDGNPELPVLPSPWVFKFLQTVVEAMGDVGTDIWSKQAVQRLKRTVRADLAEILREILEGKATDVNGSGTGDGNVDGNVDSNGTEIGDAESKDHEGGNEETSTESETNAENAKVPKPMTDTTSPGEADEKNESAEAEMNQQTFKEAQVVNPSATETPPNNNNTNDENININAQSASSPTPTSTSSQQDANIQHLFNCLILDQALSLTLPQPDQSAPPATTEPHQQSEQQIHPPQDPDRLLALCDDLRKQIDLQQEDVVRMEKGAEAYWKRVRLLFGLLVG